MPQPEPSRTPTLPEPPPLPPGREPGHAPEPEPMMISDGQRRKLQAMFRDRGILDRVERLDLCTLQVGREIGSANDLTFAEASDLMDYLVAHVPIPGHDPGKVTREQREALFALRLELDISDARLREILEAVTNQRVVAEIPADKYDAVVAALHAEAAPFE